MPVPSEPSRRYLSLWLPTLATDRLTRANPAAWPAEAPLVVAGARGPARVVVAANAMAQARGLSAGLSLADARAMHPDLLVAEEDTAADTGLLVRLADAARRFTPLVALDGADGLMLDVSGCAHLFGTERALLDEAAARFSAAGIAAQAGLASTVGAAWAMARLRPREPVVAPRGERAALSPLPLAALRLAPATVAAMGKVGLKRVADILPLPRAPLAARFGAPLLDALDRALGEAEEAISPRLPAAPYVAERRFADPVTQESAIAAAIGQLAGRLAGMLTRHGEGARRLALDLFRADGHVATLSAATARPTREADAMARLFAERLAAAGNEADPGFGFDLVRLSVTAAERLDARQATLGDRDGEEDLARLVDRLGARLGLRRVTRLVPHDSFIPEFAVIAVPAHRAGTYDLDARWQAAGPAPRDDAPAARPLKLFDRPEPVEAVAAVPDGPPIRFRWRSGLHEVARAEGPERIAPEWWKADAGAATRDYYRVEDRDGRRFWLYRDGLYRETTRPRWFLHGTFA